MYAVGIIFSLGYYCCQKFWNVLLRNKLTVMSKMNTDGLFLQPLEFSVKPNVATITILIEVCGEDFVVMNFTVQMLTESPRASLD